MATLYWLGTTSTAWATASNWTLNSNGTVNTPAAAPSTPDTVIFNSFSGGGAAAGSVTIAAPISITNLTIAGSPGVTLTSATAYSFAVTGTTSYQGGTFTLGNTGAVALGTVTVTSAASSGTFTVSNTASCTMSSITFASTGANFTVANSTTLSGFTTGTSTISITGSAGTLSFLNGTTQAWNVAGINFSSTGANFTIGGTSITNVGVINVPVGATGGTLKFQNSGTIGVDGAFTYASNNAIVQFTSAVTTVTFSAANATLAITGTVSNVTFNCASLVFTDITAMKAGPCNMTCNFTVNQTLSSSCTITSDITTTGQFILNANSTSTFNLNSYIVTATSANVAHKIAWNFGSGTGSGPRINLTGTSGTVLTVGVDFNKTVVSPSTGAFYLTGGGSSARSVVTSASSAGFANVYIPSGTFTLTPATGSLYFGAVDFTGFTGTVSSATAMTVSGNLTLGSGMTFSPTGLTFAGTSTFTSNGVTLTSGAILINTASITVTLGDNMSFPNNRLNLFKGGLNLNDKYIEVSSFGNYDGIMGNTGAITLNGGASSSGIIYIRGTGAGSPGSSAPFFGPYTANGTTYTVTNNPTVIFEPFDANVVTLATVGVWCYSNLADILPSMVFKNSVGGLSYTASFVTGSPRVRNFTYDTNFTGTHSSNLDIITLGNLYLGASVILGSSATAGFTTQVPTGSTGVVTVNQSLARPIDIENATTGITKLLTPITTTQSVTLTTGTLDLNNYALTTKSFLSSVAGTRGISFGTSGKIVVNGTGTVWNLVETITVSGTSRVEVDNNTIAATTITSTTTQTVAGEAQALNFYIKSGSYALTLNSGAVFKTLDFTGFTGSFVATNNPFIMGDLIIPDTVGNFDGTGIITMYGSTGTNYINVAKVIDRPFTFNLSTGTNKTWQLLNNLTLWVNTSSANGAVIHTTGIVDLNGKTLTCRTYSSTGTLARALTFNGGTLFANLGGTTAAGTNAVTISGRNFSTKLSDFDNLPAGTICCGADNTSVGYGNKIFSGGGCSFTGTIANDVLTLATATTGTGTTGISVGQYLYACPATPVTSVPPSPYDSGKFLGYVTEIISGGVTGTGLNAYASAIGNQVRLSITQPSPLTTAISMRATTLFPEMLQQTWGVLTIDGNHTFTRIRSGLITTPTAILFTAGTVNGMRDLQYGNVGSGTSFTGTVTTATTAAATSIAITVTSGRVWPGAVIYGHPNIPAGTRITLQTTGTVVGGTATYSLSNAVTGVVPAGAAIYAQNDCTIDSVNTAGGYHFLSDPSGVKTWIDFVSLKNSYASGGAIWYAGASCNDGGNNVNWFLSRPTANFHFFT